MGSPPVRTAADQWTPGTWNIRCSLCGEKLKFDDAKKHWQGMYRCTKCWEPRPAQDFVHSINSKEMAVPYTLKDTDIDIIAPAFPASGVAVTNSFSVPVTVFWYSQGANISQIKVNGSPLVGFPSKYSLPAGQTTQFTYTNGKPMWNWQGSFQ